MTAEGDLLWEPSPERVASARVSDFARHLGLELDYPALWQWSVANLDEFWRRFAEWSGVRWSTPPTAALANATMPGAVWFPGATVNYAEHALYPPAGADKDDVAVVFLREDGRRRTITWREL